MSHVRVFNHYLHLPYIYLALVEYVAVVVGTFAGYRLYMQRLPADPVELLPTALTIGLVVMVSMLAMGVYQARLREGFTGMMLRTAVAFFLLGGLGMGLLFYAIPDVWIGRGALAACLFSSFALVTMVRLVATRLLDEDALKHKVLVLGTGEQALRIALRMRRRSDQRGFRIVGFVEVDGTPDKVSYTKVKVVRPSESLHAFCMAEGVSEIVVAVDERRRRSEGSAAGFPLDDLLDCRLSGINIIDVIGFLEREAGRLDLDLLSPSWMVFSEGFSHSPLRDGAERLLDIVASGAILLATWPVMLLTALAIKLEDGAGAPVFYRQVRVGKDGSEFRLTKFRSMIEDAEKDGAQWAQKNDARVTRVGAFIRKTRIDELPQVFNVFAGTMSLVGPRPERPEFVEQLAAEIPYYRERHRVKPGITGWAQLCYPYGASSDDARRKLEYDLYYLKNHSVILDLLIVIQTVEVVLLGDGAR